MAANMGDRQYQNYSFSELLEIIQTNPNKGVRLNNGMGISSVPTSPAKDDETSLGIKGMSFRFLKPAGLLSVFTWITNPLFRDASPNVAKSMRLEFGTDFLTGLDSRLAGGRFLRKRRAISEWMNTLTNLPGILTKDVEVAVSTLCEVQGFHAIIVSNFSTELGGAGAVAGATGMATNHTHVFFSSNPGDWQKDQPVWIFDVNGTWILEQTADRFAPNLALWLEDKEKEGWIIDWPSVDPDTKKTDMVETLRESVTWTESDEKLKKDILGPRYIRYKVLKVLRSISYGQPGQISA